jgi:xanthine dehydrogenase accessory factor
MNTVLHALNTALINEETVVLLTVIEVIAAAGYSINLGSKRLYYADGHSVGSLGEQLLDSVLDKEMTFRQAQRMDDTFTIATTELKAPETIVWAQTVGQAFSVRILVEVLRPQPYLLICGAGHIARALATMGLILGFRPLVIDDRAEFAHRDYFPDARVQLHAQAFTQTLSELKVGHNTAVVIVTRGHKHDEDCLRMLLSSPAHYIGMIGSRRRVAVVKEKLTAEGFSAAQLARIYAPIGLDIAARTPEEIALTILAEIVLVRNRGEKVRDCCPLSRQQRLISPNPSGENMV